ncbi:MAG: cupin domain-containing protein [Kiloniellales bacterium]|nr:cupin domain-containing protein [Kiloniellales bacterium]
MTIEAVPEVQHDDGRVRVTKWNFAPGAETGWHRHEYNYIVVPVTTGALTIVSAEGETRSELTIGQSYARKVGVEHNVINRNDFPFAFVEIEFLK